MMRIVKIFFLLLAWTSPAYAVNDPVSYWKLDGDATDSAGTNDGTLQGGPVYVPGKHGQALNFDGTDDYVDLGTPAPLSLTGALTLSAWVYIDGYAPTENPHIVTKCGDASARGWYLGINGSENKLYFGIAQDATTTVAAEASLSSATGRWAHFAGVYEPGNAVRLYIDGIEQASLTTGIPASQYNSPRNALIGNRADCSNCLLNGRIDDVRVYDRALSAGEIQALYSAKCIDPVGVEAEFVYNTTYNVAQVCNGTDWMAMGDLAPAAGGGGCSNPTGVEGEMIYNSTHKVMQFCNGENWMSMNYSAPLDCAAPSLCPSVGDICDDANAGNDPDPVFAGFLVYTNSGCTPLYAAQSDQSAGVEWKTSSGSPDIATDHLEDGRLNDAQVPDDPAFPAFKLCKDLADGGFTDWYLPARLELDLLFRNQSAIGGFTPLAYWSSVENNNDTAWRIVFGSGLLNGHLKTNQIGVRCVRRD